MKHYSRVEELAIRVQDLEEVIHRLRDNRADMLRLRRGAADHIKDILGERLEVNARTLMTLTTTLAAIRGELRREKAAVVHGGEPVRK